MKTLLLFSLFFSSYLLSSEPGQQAQHPTGIQIFRQGDPLEAPSFQLIQPGTGEGSTKPELGGRPDIIGVGAMGPHEDTHIVLPGSDTDTVPGRP